MHYEFGGYGFSTEAGLSLRGQPVHLTPKASQLLELLLAADGDVVAKDALVAAMWGGGDVADDSISRSVYRLRSAMLGAGGPDVVATIYGAGFRMNVPIRATLRRSGTTAHAFTQSVHSNAVWTLM